VTPKTKKPIRCAIYCRVSTDEGLAQDFNSLDNQRERAEAYVRSQENWVALPEVYNDGGFSGANTDRPALQRLLADMETAKFDCLIVYRTDRLSRSILDFLRLLERMEKADVAYVSVTEAFSTRTPAGRLMLHLLLSFAEYERELVSERTKHKIAGAKRKGRWCGGRPVLGYDVDPAGGGLVVNEEEAQRVRAIFELYLKHGSLIPTVRNVNARGWTSKVWTSRKRVRHGGTAFLKNTLHHLLSNPTYIGRVKFDGELYPGEHPAIIDENLWNEVQQRLKSNGNGGAGQRYKHSALLRGLLWCQPCSLPMYCSYTQRGPKRYRYYFCSSATKKGAATCPSKPLPAQEIEQFVVAEIRRVSEDPAVVEAVREVGGKGGLDSAWAGLGPEDRERLVRTLIDRISYDEPSRFFRRVYSVTPPQAVEVCWWRLYSSSCSAGGTYPIGSSKRRLLYQSTHSRVANSTSARERHGPRGRMISVLNRPITDSASALS